MADQTLYCACCGKIRAVVDANGKCPLCNAHCAKQCVLRIPVEKMNAH